MLSLSLKMKMQSAKIKDLESASRWFQEKRNLSSSVSIRNLQLLVLKWPHYSKTIGNNHLNEMEMFMDQCFDHVEI